MTTERIWEVKYFTKGREIQTWTAEKEFGFAVKTETVAKLHLVATDDSQKIPSRGITHKGFPSDSIVQDYVQYAWEISDKDLNFLTMMDCENGTRDTHRRGDGGKSLGLCQLHGYRHKEVFDPEFKSDWKLQINICYEKWKYGTKFYWPDRLVKWWRCWEVVKDRFLFN